MHENPAPAGWSAVPPADDAAFAAEPMLVAPGGSWSRARLADTADRLAAGLAAFGIVPGDRVALHLRNGPEIACAYLACFRLGAVAVPLNLRFKQAELEHALRRLRPRIYIGERDLFGPVAAIDASVLPADARFVVGAAGNLAARPWALLHGDPGAAPAPCPSDPRAPAVLLLTSGTTGVPKFVAHSLASLTEGADRLRHLDLQAGQRVAFPLPMTHISGLCLFMGALRLGYRLVLCDAADPGAMLDSIEEHACDVMVALPAMASLLVAAQRARARDVSSLTLCVTGGDTQPDGLQEAWRALSAAPLRSFWASTEAIGSFSHAQGPGAPNRLLPGTGMRIVDEAGAPVAQGEAGEMLLRGPHVMLGYWQESGALEGLDDGWYRSGDLMRADASGAVRFVGRLKDLIVRGGSNISPVEVERVIAAHPAVEEAAVAGVPDPVLGQRVMGVVRLKAGADADACAAILAAASPRLADYKLPERLFPVAELPRNALGKVDRRSVSAMLEARLALRLPQQARA
ncbi:MAG: class I adenylate-forming enzyme family protein [Janthinobacterium lividum]